MQSTHSISIAQGPRQRAHPVGYKEKWASPRDCIAQQAIKNIVNTHNVAHNGAPYRAKALWLI